MTDSGFDDPLLAAAPLVDGYRVLGPCLIYAKVGQGGMGAVFRGRHVNLDIEVAVKCLKRSLADEDPDFVARFQREARLAASLNSPHLVRVFDVSERAGLHYLVMEFVEGETLRERVRRKGALGAEEAASILLGAARGLAAAHDRGIVHRDVKPDNVMVSVAGDVKVADLGLAKALEAREGMTSTHTVLGTPQYMPPEQWEGTAKVGPQGDVWALGATLFFLLAGRDPIAGGTLTEVLRRVCFEPFPDLREAVPGVPAALAAVVEGAVARAPADRFPDAGALAEALQAAVGAEAPTLSDPAAGSETARRTMVSPPPPASVARARSTAAEELPVTTPAISGAAVSKPSPAPTSTGEEWAQPIPDAPTTPASLPRPRPPAPQAPPERSSRGVLAAMILIGVLAVGIPLALRIFGGSGPEKEPGAEGDERTKGRSDPIPASVDPGQEGPGASASATSSSLAGVWVLDREETLRVGLTERARREGARTAEEIAAAVERLRRSGKDDPGDFSRMIARLSVRLVLAEDGTWSATSRTGNDSSGGEEGTWTETSLGVRLQKYGNPNGGRPEALEALYIDGRLRIAEDGEPPMVLRRAQGVETGRGTAAADEDGGGAVGGWVVDVRASIPRMVEQARRQALAMKSDFDASESRRMAARHLREVDLELLVRSDRTFAMTGDEGGDRVTVEGVWRREGERVVFQPLTRGGRPVEEDMDVELGAKVVEGRLEFEEAELGMPVVFKRR